MNRRYVSQASCPAAKSNPAPSLKRDRLERRLTGACESIPAKFRDPRPQHLQDGARVRTPLEREIANISHSPRCSPAHLSPARSRVAGKICPRKSTVVLEHHRTPNSQRSRGDQGENPEAGFEVAPVLRMHK